MVEFLQAYGIWIFLGLLFLLVLRSGRGSGSCCGVGDHADRRQEDRKESPEQEPDDVGHRSRRCH